MVIVNVICGWCRKAFETENKKNTKLGVFKTRVCPHCGKLVNASRKELTGNSVGRKRWKFPSQTGDVV